jgi:hypothetical protein
MDLSACPGSLNLGTGREWSSISAKRVICCILGARPLGAVRRRRIEIPSSIFEADGRRLLLQRVERVAASRPRRRAARRASVSITQQTRARESFSLRLRGARPWTPGGRRGGGPEAFLGSPQGNACTCTSRGWTRARARPGAGPDAWRLRRVRASDDLERVQAGLRRARAQGKKLGRPRVPEKIEQAICRERPQGRDIHAVARTVGAGTGTVQRLRAELMKRMAAVVAALVIAAAVTAQRRCQSGACRPTQPARWLT